MGITATEAAEIARRHGLSLQDAAGLASLANSTEEAEQLAARFSTPESEMNRFVKGLFAKAGEHETLLERRLRERAEADTAEASTA